MRLLLILRIRGIGCPCLYRISSNPSYTKKKYVGALRSSTGPWHLSMSYSWSPRSRVPHQRQPLPLIVSDGLTKEVCLGLHYPVKRIRELGRKSGWLFVALYLKQASTTCLMQYYSTTGKYKPDSLSVSISLTRSGLSRIIPPYHRKMISKRDDRADVLVRLYLSAFTAAKIIRLAKKVSRATFCLNIYFVWNPFLSIELPSPFDRNWELICLQLMS